MHTSPAYYDLIEAFAQPDCAVCRLVQREVAHYLESLLYEYVTEGEIQAAVRASRGFCNAHGWQLTQTTGSALGITILYRAALDETLKTLARLPDSTGTSRFKRLFNGQASETPERLAPTQPCLGCERQTEATQRYTRMTAEYIADERFQRAYEASSGLCLAHLRDVLQYVADADAPIFINTQQRIWAELKAELETFIEHDTALSDDRIGAEGTSRFRAIAALSGAKPPTP